MNHLSLLLSGFCILLMVCAVGAETTAEDIDPYLTILDNSDIQSQITTALGASLSPDEIADLAYMYEEEKLTRDVYTVLAQTSGLAAFSSISGAEQTHMDSVGLLLDRYGLSSLKSGDSPGTFNNETLQALYLDLVSQGEVSPVDALKVGAFIEELDIYDLEQSLMRTSHPDIVIVYENLMKGSRNHLRAFVNNLNRYGISYAPQILPDAEYNSIVSSGVERGRN